MDKSPTTLEQVRAAMARMISVGQEPPADLFGESTDNRFTIRIPTSVGIVLTTNNQTILIEFKHKRLALDTADFSVRYAYKGSAGFLSIRRIPDQQSFLEEIEEDLRQIKHPASFDRMLRAVRTLDSTLPRAAIKKVTQAPSDSQALLEAVQSSVTAQNEDDPIRAAKLRGVLVHRQMLEFAGGSLSSVEVAKLLNISRQAVHKRLAAKQLFAVTDGRRKQLYPSFQFSDGGKTLPGLEAVLRNMSDVDPWMQLSFFTGRSGRLDNKTPMEVLQEGQAENVMRLANTVGEQGAR